MGGRGGGKKAPMILPFVKKVMLTNVQGLDYLLSWGNFFKI